jgi:hypothetical protein
MNTRSIHCCIVASILLSAPAPEVAQGQSPDTVAIMQAFGRVLVSGSHGNRIALVRNLAIRGDASGPRFPDAARSAKELKLLSSAVTPGLELLPAAPQRTDPVAVQAHFRLLRHYRPYYEVERIAISENTAEVVASAYEESATLEGPIGTVKVAYHFVRKDGRWSLDSKEGLGGATLFRYLGPPVQQ